MLVLLLRLKGETVKWVDKKIFLKGRKLVGVGEEMCYVHTWEIALHRTDLNLNRNWGPFPLRRLNFLKTCLKIVKKLIGFGLVKLAII